MLQDILVCSKVLQDYYQVSHWQCKNTVFYGDHLLFGRLYDEAGKHIDGLGEKLIGIGMPSSLLDLPEVYKKSFQLLKDLPFSCKENIQFVQAALPLEDKLIALCVEVDASEETSLGVKNFVAQIADDAEGRIYLLKQRMNSASPASASPIVAPGN